MRSNIKNLYVEQRHINFDVRRLTNDCHAPYLRAVVKKEQINKSLTLLHAPDKHLTPNKPDFNAHLNKRNAIKYPWVFFLGTKT